MPYKALFSLLGRKRIKNMLLLLPAMLICSLLEMLGIGMIVSVCTLLVNDRWFYENPVALRARSLLHLQQGNDMIMVTLFALFIRIQGVVFGLGELYGRRICANNPLRRFEQAISADRSRTLPVLCSS